MKKIALSLVILFGLGFSALAQIGNGPEIEFNNDVHDFGEVMQHGNTTTEFVFTNTGDEPLIISNARGSCGCTVPEWPKKPINPGETASIKVKYDNKRVGPINKSVTITSNATNEPTTVLRIKGNIKPAPAEQTMPVKDAAGAPVNN